MKYRYLLSFIIALFCFQLQSQDVHFSYYQFAPTVVNPALTGAFYGNIRATALHRGQWNNVRANPDGGRDGFNTTSLLIDGNLPFGFKKGDWVSAGINIMMEGNTAGVIDMKRSFNGLSLAYHMVLSKKTNNILTFSLKYGKYGQGFNSQGAEFSSPQLLANPGADDLDVNNIPQAQSGDNNVTQDANDWMVGFMYTTPVGDASDMRIGLAFDHLLQPQIGQNPNQGGGGNPPIADTRVALDRRMNAFIQYYTDINEKTTLNPSLVYQSVGGYSNILLQGLVGFTPNASKDFTFNFGLGVRLADNMDVPFYVGADFKDWRVGLAFDTNVSGLTQATGNAGAYELAVSKIFSWQKKVKVDPVFICPRL